MQKRDFQTMIPKLNSSKPCRSAPSSKTQKTENERRNVPANTYCTMCVLATTLVAQNVVLNKDRHLTKRGQDDLKSSSKLSDADEDAYETVSSSSLEAVQDLRILPPKPQQDSVYADKHCLKPSGTTRTSSHPPQPPQYLPKHTSVLEARKMPNVKGERVKIYGLQKPLPPARPLKTLPKQYHPLPPAPKISSHALHTRETPSQSHTFPVSAKPTRHLSFRDLNEASGRDKDTRKKLELIVQEQQYKAKHLPEASFQHTQSSKNICSSGSTVNAENVSVKRSPTPICYITCENKPKHSPVKEEMEYTAQPTEKDLHKYEWYMGEYNRHEAEAALLEENTDETFLVRDCSEKSNTEPYVLVVYYGRRVYNIKVRFLEDSQQYALGTGLRGDNKFNSVKDIIDFYKYVPITLIDGKDKTGMQRVQCYLTHPLKLCKKRILP